MNVDENKLKIQHVSNEEIELWNSISNHSGDNFCVATSLEDIGLDDTATLQDVLTRLREEDTFNWQKLSIGIEEGMGLEPLMPLRGHGHLIIERHTNMPNRRFYMIYRGNLSFSTEDTIRIFVANQANNTTTPNERNWREIRTDRTLISTNDIANNAVTSDKIANISNLTNLVAIGIGAQASEFWSTALGGSTTASGGTSTALGFAAMASGLRSTALGTGARATHTNTATLSSHSTITSSTTDAQILLGNTSVTPFAYRPLSVISDQRDKVELTPLKYNALEFINKVEPKQYKLDFRSDYTRWEEVTEQEYQELEEYTKQHRVRDIPIYSIDNVIEFIEYSLDEEVEKEVTRNNSKFNTVIKSNVIKSRKEAISKYKEVQLSKKNGIKVEELTEEFIEQKITKVRDMKLQRVFLPKDGSKTNNRYHNGVLAQQVKQVADEMGFDFCGFKDHAVNGGDDLYSISYEEFIAPMIGAIQQLTKKVEDQDKIIKELVNIKMKEV